MSESTLRQHLPDRFEVRVEMLSDWHVGSGTGRPGNIDRLVIRDADDLPFIPGKTLTGMWRDAAERLAFGLDEKNENRPWARWVSWIFGSEPTRQPVGHTATPTAAALSVRSAHLPDGLRKRLRGRSLRATQLRQALTFVKPGVMLDSRTGSAREDHLRFEEMGRVGSVLIGHCELSLPSDPEQRTAASALLLASTRLVERLGGKRRRGAGRCRLEVVGSDVNSAIDWLDDHDAPVLPPVLRDPPVPPAVLPRGGDWQRIPLVLELRGPLAIPARTVGNVGEGLDFLPGTYLLPHLTRVLSGLGVDVRAAVARGDLCVLPATVEIEGTAGRPVPFALFQHKEGGRLDNPQTLVNRLVEPETKEHQLKQCRRGCLGPQRNDEQGHMLWPRFVSLEPTLLTHNTVAEEEQKPTSKVGGVYSYQAIPAMLDGRPTRLRSELRVRGDLAKLLPERWWEKVSGSCRLGRSKKDDYGEGMLRTEKPPHATPEAKVREDRLLFVWLLSDVLLRNKRLGPDPSEEGLRQELETRLNVKLQRTTCGDGLQSLTRARRMESWHTVWGLPRPSFVGLQAGSCAVYRTDGDLNPGKLREVETSGIGERTAEGYGQVSFNDPILTTKPGAYTKRPPSEDNKGEEDKSPIASEDPAAVFARLLELETWRGEIRRAALRIANKSRNEVLGGPRLPNMSQLGGLRDTLTLLRSAGDRTRVLEWLTRLSENARRRAQWQHSEPILRKVIGTDTEVWRLLESQGWPTLTKDGRTELERGLWALAVRTLVDACIRAHKRATEERPTVRTES